MNYRFIREIILSDSRSGNMAARLIGKNARGFDRRWLRWLFAASGALKR